MTKRLSLFRHAKSSWATGEDDFDRPLNEKGRKAALLTAAHIAGAAPAPELVLCSPAKRTRQTWALTAPAFSPAPQIDYEDRLYHAATADLLALIRAAPDSVDHLLIIGHNPGLEMIAVKLADRACSDADAFTRMTKKFPTAAWALIEFPCPRWIGVKPRAGALTAFATPQSLEQK